MILAGLTSRIYVLKVCNLRSQGSLPLLIQDEPKGQGNGEFKDEQRFVCAEGFAVFVPAAGVMTEKDVLEMYGTCEGSTEEPVGKWIDCFIIV